MSNVIQPCSSDDGELNWMMDVACDVFVRSRGTGLAAWSPRCENRFKAAEDMRAQGLLVFCGDTAKLTTNGLGWYADMLLNQYDNTKASKRYLDSKGFLMMVIGALGSKIWDDTAYADPGLDKRTQQVISRLFFRKGM